MYISTQRNISVVVLVTLILFSGLVDKASAQRVYSKERDEQAKAAEKLAETIKNSSLFDTQLKNLALLARKDFDAEFIGLKGRVSGEPFNIVTWGSAHAFICRIEQHNAAAGIVPNQREIDEALKRLEEAITEAQTSLEKLREELKNREAIVDPTLAALFEQLGNFSELQALAQTIHDIEPALITADRVKALAEIESSIKVLRKVYDAYKEKIRQYNELVGELGSLELTLKKVALQSLQVDEVHWKNIAVINARYEKEQTEVFILVSAYKGIVSRLRLLDFDPGKPKEFCSAVIKASSPSDLYYHRYNRTIAQSLRSLAAQAQALEKNTREIVQLADQSLFNQTGQTLDQTLAALDRAVAEIEGAELVHAGENTVKEDYKKAAKDLREARAGADQNKIATALRNVIAAANTHSLKRYDSVGDITQALYTVAALIARGETPSRLAALRTAQEDHAYSIRKSAVRARAYELTVATGVKRLALYHQGGIKPELIAELIHAASNVAIPVAIATK